jgi:hypothetical protein
MYQWSRWLCLCYEGQKLGHIIVVHGMHAGEMGACHATLESQALGIIGETFNVAGMGVIGFITMQVQHDYRAPFLNGISKALG